MKAFFLSSWLYRLTRWALGILFLYSGGAKLLDREVFAILIGAYGILPDDLIMPVAVILPALEIVVALGLFLDIRGSLAVTTGLMVLFMLILAYAIHMGLDIDCGCFGPEDPEAEAFHGLRIALCRDAVILASIVYLYIWRRKNAIKPVGLKFAFNNILKTEGGFHDEIH